MEHFFSNVDSNIVRGALKNVLKITMDPSNENYISGYTIFESTVWSYISKNLILEGPLNFLLSTANLAQFTSNFQYFNSEVKPCFSPLVSSESASKMDQLFDTDTFISVYQIELVSNF